jgi:hypothetical protein
MGKSKVCFHGKQSALTDFVGKMEENQPRITITEG